MKILFTGFVAFVIWSFFSTWLFVDILRPSLRKPAPVQVTIPEPTGNAADSLAKIYAMMPKEIVIPYGFDKSKFTPDPGFDESLAGFKSWLEKYPGSILLITGYTDMVGTPEYNLNLGLERAQAVQKYLESRGFPQPRMTAVSKGEEDPVAGYITAEERAKNRRTIISIKK
jgi:outer membrane protein OmpA-like peptidoglycan-associated protein